jgi:hypothetical protein
VNTCTSCGAVCKDESHICKHCYELAVQIALMDSKDREYLWRDNRPRVHIPTAWWVCLVGCVGVWAYLFWSILK